MDGQTQMAGCAALLPLFTLGFGSLVVLLGETFGLITKRMLPIVTSIVFVTAWITSLGLLTWGNAIGDTDFSMAATFGLIVDPLSGFSVCAILFVATLAGCIGIPLLEREGVTHPGEHQFLMLCSAGGAVTMALSGDFITFFVGLELLSLALYCMCGGARTRKQSGEAALKYFFLGCFSSAFFLYGIAMLYGLTGTLSIVPLTPEQFQGDTPVGIYLAFGFVLIGLAFKLGLFPFHAWVPDVYQGAPTSVTTFMSGMVKVAAVAAFIRIMVVVFWPVVVTWAAALWIIAIASMVFGNIVALRQRSVKRILAYSSIAHAGYIALGLTAFSGDAATLAAVLFYVCSYALVSIGAFGVVLLREVGSAQASTDDIADFNGLSKRSPWLAAAFSLFLLALSGLPPGMMGLIGKLQLFSEAIRGEYFGLALIGVLSSVVGVYYYLRIIAAMYFLPGAETTGAATTLPSSIPWLSRFGLAMVAVFVLAVGFYPEPLIVMIRKASSVVVVDTSPQPQLPTDSGQTA